MSEKVIPQRKRLSAVFASFGIVIMGTASLMTSGTLDYYSVLDTLQKLVPTCVALASLGWVMGMILDKPKKKSRSSFTSSYLNNIVTNDFVDLSINDKEEEAKEE